MALFRQVSNYLFRRLITIKIAIVIMSILTIGLIIATVLESTYDTPTAQFWVYKAFWFKGILALLGLEITAVALSRWPWKKRHIPFLTAHLGIITLLVGSWITYKFGLDASLRVVEGQSSNQVQVDSNFLFVAEEGLRNWAISIPFTPHNVPFSPIQTEKEGVPIPLRVQEYIPHATPVIDFQKTNTIKQGRRVSNAIQFKIEGGPMKISQDFWLWSGDTSWSFTQAGPARVFVDYDPGETMPGPWLSFKAKGNDLFYRSRNAKGDFKSGIFKENQVKDALIETGWKMVKVSVLKWVPGAENKTRYKPAEIPFGPSAPPSAVKVKLGDDQNAEEAWLALGDRTEIQAFGKSYVVAYTTQAIYLPFFIRLEQFTVEKYQGSRDPAAYSSRVRVIEGQATGNEIEISMNEPLKHQGYTFYQASFEDGDPRPIVSIFSVNKDPGRWIKYIGSILIVLGSLLLFGRMYLAKKQAPSIEGIL